MDTESLYKNLIILANGLHKLKLPKDAYKINKLATELNPKEMLMNLLNNGQLLNPHDVKDLMEIHKGDNVIYNKLNEIFSWWDEELDNKGSFEPLKNIEEEIETLKTQIEQREIELGDNNKKEKYNKNAISLQQQIRILKEELVEELEKKEKYNKNAISLQQQRRILKAELVKELEKLEEFERAKTEILKIINK
jgi:hypothetical protein